MSFSHLLDTSVLSQPLKERPLRTVQRRWTPERSARFCTPAICQAELLRGLAERGSERLWRRYHEYLEGEVAVVPFDAGCAMAYGLVCAQLKEKGNRRDMADMLVAATAIAHGLVLATLNARHFADLDDLPVEDWSH